MIETQDEDQGKFGGQKYLDNPRQEIIVSLDRILVCEMIVRFLVP